MWFMAMMEAAWHVVMRAFSQTVNRFSTSKLAVLVAVLAFLIPHIWTWVQQERSRQGLTVMVRKIWQNLGGGTILVLAVWLCLIGWSSLVEIYKDNSGFTQVTRILKHEKFELVGENKRLAVENEKLKSCSTTRVVTHNVTAKPEKQCWMADYFGMPNSKVEGARTATSTIIHCNYKVDAPMRVIVTFDTRDFVYGSLTFPGASLVMSGGCAPGKQGNTVWACIGSPAMLTGQLAIMTVYGTTDKYPHAVKGGIQSLQ